ncbi:MAG TPA: hypothetical protein DEO94_02785 [Cyanobacteria bacterium UBA11991]|jgi:predicted transposase YbfD/YdcC|nr:hypothetical protein [Cyanobacteriota bacterium]MDY6358582.1 hypothetical protein [Cyanobacteriota bacterium]MDY6364615.1 hypothetical protein [Cyanobacteriota bacterium]MDY6383051.1 hypothetical protein [Cyanobacteriota bacterium]HCB11071.1 hypothetical protein [Cyanobacteria bacterium UBA11991]
MGLVDGIARVHGAATNLKAPKLLDKKFQKNAEAALGLATVTSIVLKDGIGCVMYVAQSLNNKRIPDEKRKFVASLDLTNGILMILAQIGMFFAMRKYSGPIFNKLFKKSFNKIAKENSFSRIRMLVDRGDEFARKLYGKVAPKKGTIDKDYEKVKDGAKSLFKFVADIAAATIIGKRVIVPLIATPLAKHVENWMDKKDKKGAKVEDAPKAAETKPEVDGKKLDIVSTSDNGDTNLIEQYKHNNIK